VSVFTVTGHFLWREKWSQRRYEPAIERSADASRVALSTIAGTGGTDANKLAASQDSGEERWPQVEQAVRVVDAATGKVVISTKSEAVLKGQNFSLSPDGTRLVVIDRPSLKIFDLPPMTGEDRAKYAALQTDAPTLTAPGLRSSSENSASDEVFDVASNDAEEAQQVAPVDAPTPGVEARTQTGSAQPSPEKTTDTTAVTFKTSSKTVVVDVVITDSKGRPIRGLSAQDFQMQEDGKPQRVNYFHEFSGAVSGGNDSGKPAPAAEPALPRNVFTNNQLTREDEPVTVFLLDLLNTPPQAQWFAEQELIKFLKNKPKSSQFALCALTNSLHLIQGFTTDEGLLIVSARGKKGGTHWSPLLEVNKGLIAGKQMQQEVAAFDPSKQFVVQMFEQAAAEERADELDRRVSITTDAFAQLARYLAGVPGRKNVVWLSASFPLGIFPNNDLFNAFSETRSYEALMKRTANLLAEAHVAVYPVDARGLMAETAFAASSAFNPAPPSPGSLAPAPAGAVNTLANTSANAQSPNPFMQATHESLENQVGDQSTMDQIASDTGGKAFYNTNGITEAIQTAVEQGSNYYMLSYTPSNRNYDGRFRKIKVSLSSKNYHLAYRRGYFADDPSAPQKQDKDSLSHDVGVAAMQHGSPQSHQIVFATRVVPVGNPTKPESTNPSGARKRRKGPAINEVQRYAVDFAIAAPQLRFVEQADLHHGVFAFMMSSFDDEGKALSRLASRTTADLKASSYRDVMVSGFRIRQEFDVPTNAAFLRLGVEDELTRNLGTVEVALPIPVPPDDPTLRAHVLPPIEPD
jgi:VWFA-related protein